MDVCVASPRPDSLMLRGSVEPAQTLLKGHLMLQDNYRLYMDIESTCQHMDWQDLYVPTFLEQYDYAPMANLWTTTLHEANYCMIGLFQSGMFYLQSLQSLSYIHTPSFYTYVYTFLRFRVHVKS